MKLLLTTINQLKLKDLSTIKWLSTTHFIFNLSEYWGALYNLFIYCTQKLLQL